MPRRNRNAKAPRIDADALAVQADRLTAEFGRVNGRIVYLADETELIQLGAITGTGKPDLLRDYITRFIHQHPGCQISLADAKAVSHAS